MSDTLTIGAIAWSRVRKGADEKHRGGMVVDVGTTSNNESYVVVLDDSVTAPVKAWKLRNRVVARRIMLTDVDESLTQPADKVRMVNGARSALLTVGCGSKYFTQDEKDLAYWGAVLLEEATS